jgi:hypothetical protein
MIYIEFPTQIMESDITLSKIKLMARLFTKAPYDINQMIIISRLLENMKTQNDVFYLARNLGYSKIFRRVL